MGLHDYLLLGIGAVLLLLIYYIFSRDAQLGKQIRAIAKAIEDLHHQIYTVEQNVDKHLTQLQSKSERFMSEDDLRYELEVGVGEQILPLKKELETLRNRLDETSDGMQKRLLHVEEHLKMLSMPQSMEQVDEERIERLFKEGSEIDAIAKELRVSKRVVEFILKMKKLK